MVKAKAGRRCRSDEDKKPKHMRRSWSEVIEASPVDTMTPNDIDSKTRLLIQGKRLGNC